MADETRVAFHRELDEIDQKVVQLFALVSEGVVDEVGPGVRDFRKGMKVVALNSAPCGSCFYCVRRQENLACVCKPDQRSQSPSTRRLIFRS